MKGEYKKFIDNGNGDCVYCCEKNYDCCCGEKTAESLGYKYEHIVTTKKVEVPPMPKGLDIQEMLKFHLENPHSIKTSVGVWRKGKRWFRHVSDLVDYHNRIGSINEK